MDENEIYEYWFLKKNLAKETQKQYLAALKHYTRITRKTLEELYREGYQEEKDGVMLVDRGYSYYILKLKKDLENKGKSPSTIRNYVNAVKSLYDTFDIRPPKVTVPTGDMTLEQNYGRLWRMY